MTMNGMGWGLGLEGVISSVAKLVAIRLGDGCDQEGSGSTNIDALAAWCCADRATILKALRELEIEHDVHWGLYGDTLNYRLPIDAQTPDRPQYGPDITPMELYVITSVRHGTKVGITRDIKARVAGLKTGLMDDSITAVWSLTGPAYLVRRAERNAHRRLVKHLIRNEWFSATTDIAIAAATAAYEEEGGKSG